MSASDEPAELKNEIGQLHTALASQPVIEHAKGMLMLLRNWTGNQAFAALREVSQHANVKLHDVAAVIVSAGAPAEPSGIDQEVSQQVLHELRLRVLGSGFGT
ncbi:ANTAR domain-containing protein [Amycolatopsis azurea]|uniref:ANTAR domain-containing protein n=2 Tax=Amycolatopsis azurea DSM 43854 TaxID=1238180 RepID=A0ABX3J3V9_9PSEU|nr:ANTAR domain-containing protein [Amycolatopsis azurea]OOC01874.1 ANTAR domain-containing protein [Amycolatopsis azurea DSM 43854]